MNEVRVARVAGRHHDDDPGGDRFIAGDRRCVERAAVIRAQRHVDHVEVVRQVVVVVRIHRPVDRLRRQVGAPVAPEHADGVQRSLGCAARRDSQRRVRRIVAVVRTGERGAAGGHAEPCGGARDVTAMPVAVHRIRIGGRRIGADVRIAGKVGPADDLGGGKHAVGGRESARRRRLGLIVGKHAGAAEVAVHVVDAGIDNADPDAGPVGARRESDRIRPDLRGADVRDAGRAGGDVGDDRQHALDPGDVREPAQRGRVDGNGDAVQHLRYPVQLARTECRSGQQCGHLRLRVLDTRDLRLGRTSRGGRRQPVVRSRATESGRIDDRSGRILELDHHDDLSIIGPGRVVEPAGGDRIRGERLLGKRVDREGAGSIGRRRQHEERRDEPCDQCVLVHLPPPQGDDSGVYRRFCGAISHISAKLPQSGRFAVACASRLSSLSGRGTIACFRLSFSCLRHAPCDTTS